MEREDYKLLPLATVGLAKGAWEVYIKPELTPKRLAILGSTAIASYALIKATS